MKGYLLFFVLSSISIASKVELNLKTDSEIKARIWKKEMKIKEKGITKSDFSFGFEL